MKCYDCPRRCGANRAKEPGFCGAGEPFKVAKIMKHRFEEPVISGACGSGAIFFSGCNLKCVYCQNYEISIECKGEEYSEEKLSREILELQSSGVHNVDFITAAPYTARLALLLENLKPRLIIPAVYNSGGYESVKTLKKLSGLIDVYLPDYKYFSSELSSGLSSAPDYSEVAEAAITEMVRQTGPSVIEDGIMKRGVLIRHLVLPGQRKDSIAVLERIAALFGDAVLVSVMRQYTPGFNRGPTFLNRKVTSYEYGTVADKAAELRLKGFMQLKGCESAEFTPVF